MTSTACVVSIALLAGVLAGCGQAQPSSTSAETTGPTTRPSLAETAGSSMGASIDLAAILPGPGDEPGGLRFDYSVTGPETLTMVVVTGRNAEFAALPGFVDGRATAFSGSSGVLLTVALAFVDGGQADLAKHRYMNELAEGYRLKARESAGFTIDAVCATGLNTALGDLEESICIWQRGPVVFLVGGALPMATIRGISEGLNDGAAHLRWPP